MQKFSNHAILKNIPSTVAVAKAEKHCTPES
jgi:hypothetical protein